MIEHPLEEGQLVRITVDDEKVIEGPCVDREPSRIGDYLKMEYKIASIKTLLYKYPLDESYAIDSAFSDIIEDCCNDQAGIVPGNIDTSSVLSETLNTDAQSKGKILDTLAEADGLDWWINHDYTLDFGDNEASIEDAPHDLDSDFGTFSDYRNVTVSSDYDNYHNQVTIIGQDYDGVVLKAFASDRDSYDASFFIGGYDTAISQVLNDNSLFFKPIIKIAEPTTNEDYVYDEYTSNAPTVLVDDVFYNKTRKQFSLVSRVLANSSTVSIFYINPPITGQTAGDIIMYNREFSQVAQDRVRAHGGHPKQNISFMTYTAGFKVRQRIYFNDPKLGVMKIGAITGVTIYDRGAGKTEYEIMIESKTPAYFNVISNSNYVKFFRRF
jgi:hypothetical protein